MEAFSNQYDYVVRQCHYFYDVTLRFVQTLSNTMSVHLLLTFLKVYSMLNMRSKHEKQNYEIANTATDASCLAYKIQQ